MARLLARLRAATGAPGGYRRVQANCKADQRDAGGEAVIWSKLSSVQRAYLACSGATAPKQRPQRFVDPTPHGRIDAAKSLKERQKDADVARDAMNKCWQLAALSVANVQVKKLPAGHARNANYLQRKTARALPMGQGINGRVR